MGYGDLATLGGTSPEAAGNRMLSNPALSNAYRVLDAQGGIAAGFQWHDRERTHPVREVLEAEGIRFDADGRADPAQRLTALQIAHLIECECEREELDRLVRTLAASPEAADGL